MATTKPHRRRARSTRRKRVRSGREATCFEPSADGQPPGGGEKFRAEPNEHPNCSGGGVRAALVRWHGLPGQRERRRGSTDRATGNRGPAPATEIGSPIAEVGGLRQRRPVRRPSRSGRHRDRVTDLAPWRQRSRVRPDDRVSEPRGRGSGNRSSPSGRHVLAGFAREEACRTVPGPGSPGRLAEKGHRPPRPLRGTTTGDVIGRDAG
jgi:hypothetical protein